MVENLAADMESLIKETYSFLSEVQDTYSRIRGEASDRHLGLADDALHDTAREVVEDQDEIFSLIEEKTIGMYNFFFLNQGKKPQGRLNKGHLAEAYERIL